MATTNYYEKQLNKNGTASYLFTKRLNPKHGWFPGFKSKVKRKLSAESDAEAKQEALRVSNALTQLQSVCSRDSKGHPISSKEQRKAAETWYTFVMEVNIQQLNLQTKGRTKEALEARAHVQRLKEEILDGFNQRVIDAQSTNGFKEWLTPFGDTLLTMLEGGSAGLLFSEATETYLKQTQRDHLPTTSKSVRDITRNIAYFIEVIGDKPLTQIARADVERYIFTRLQKVKTTSVQREVNTLRAAWEQCALVHEFQQKNPFSKQPITGLGTDSVARTTPSLQDTQKLLVMLQARQARLPSSYVSAVVAIAALTGSRLSEIWGLVKEDYLPATNDDTVGVLHIRKNIRRANLKNKNSIRPFPVLPELAQWLEVLFKTRRPKNSNSASAGTLASLKREGFKFGNHSLRHGFKQQLTEIDTPGDTINELCGWGAQRQQDSYGFKTVTKRKAATVRKVYDLFFDCKPVSNVVSADFQARL